MLLMDEWEGIIFDADLQLCQIGCLSTEGMIIAEYSRVWHKVPVKPRGQEQLLRLGSVQLPPLKQDVEHTAETRENKHAIIEKAK